jgi:hypothetical protein
MQELVKMVNFFSATAIHTRKFRIPSDLRRQVGNGSVSTMVGDHMGILGAVVFFLDYIVDFLARVNVFFMHSFTDTVFLQSFSSTLHASIPVCLNGQKRYCNISLQYFFRIGQDDRIIAIP